MIFKLKFTPEADKQLNELENNPSKKAACKAVSKFVSLQRRRITV